MNLQNKRPRYRSDAPRVPGPGGTPLLGHLSWDADRNAPSFCAGNLLVHGPSTEDPDHHHLDPDAGSFRRAAPVSPGLHHTSVFPSTASVETNDRFTDEAGSVRFFFRGREVGAEWLASGRIWTPWSVQDEFRVGNLRVRQTVTIAAFEYADVLGCRLELEGDREGWELEVAGRVYRVSEVSPTPTGLRGCIVGEAPDFRFITRPGYDGPWGATPAPSKAVGTCYEADGFFDGVPAAWDLSGRGGWTYRQTRPAPVALWLLLGVGFEAGEVSSAMDRARADLPGVLDRSRQWWTETFRRDVPGLSCSDPALERVYAESLATGFLSTYDVPYDPFRHPISVPAGKFSANWHQQFWHDSLFASRTFLWLNDPGRCQQDLLQMIDVQFIHARPDFGEPYPDPAHLFHPQLNFLAMVGWQIYCRTRDRGLIRIVLDRFLDFDRRKCRPLPGGSRPRSSREEEPAYSILRPHRHYDEDGNWLVTSALAGDDTCRADPFMDGHRAKHWYEEPEVSLELVDSNWYLLGNRRALRLMAGELGDTCVVEELDAVMEAQVKAMEQWMWMPDLGCYLDVEAFTGRPTVVADIGSITPALANALVPQARADRLIEDLLDPQKFWTPLPAPSCPVHHPGTHGKPGFRPEGYWRGRVWPVYVVEAIEGLYEYGRRDHAAYLTHLFLKTLAASPVPSPENLNPLDRSVPGYALMGFGAQFVHPLLRFVTGLQMRPDDDLAFDPIALDPSWSRFEFGPFWYRPGVELTVSWSPDKGYGVRVNGQSWRFPVPTKFTLAAEGGSYRLDQASVTPLEFVGDPPVGTVLESTPGGAKTVLVNRTRRETRGTLVMRLLRFDHGLTVAETVEFVLGPYATQEILLVPSRWGGAQWLLTSTSITGYPVVVAEGLSLENRATQGES